MSQDRDEELQREIQTHLDLEAEERASGGLSERDARLAARRAFGNVTRVTEEVRTVWTRVRLDDLVQDLRYALRALRKAPGFTTVAVVTLALGIGANTAIFSVVNAVVLQPLGYPQPHQLMYLTTRVEGFDEFWASAPEYFELTELSQSFSVIGAFRTAETNLAALERPRRVKRAEVNAEVFEALGVPAALGRVFRREETRPNGPQITVLSHDLWRSAFAASPDLVGRTIDIDGVPREVVGVMPQEFDLLDQRIDLWQPLQLEPSNREEWNRNTHIVYLVGRLKDGVSPARAQAELDALNASWRERVGANGHVFTPGAHVMQMKPVQDEVVGSAWQAVWVLQAAVAFVLLIACTNLANLLLARADTRHHELRIRAALGAGRGRLLAQFTTEGVVLAVLGAVVGLAFAWALVRGLTMMYPQGLPRATEIGIDPVVLGVTLAVALVTGLAFGLAPLRHVSKPFLGRLLVEGMTRGGAGGRRPVRRGLVAAEVALAVVLVAGAGLMLRTVINLMNVDAGFERSRLVTFGVGLPSATYGTFEQRRQLYHGLADRLASFPGVQRVAAMSGLPPNREFNAIWTDIEGYTPTDRPNPVVDYYQTVTAGYFETMGTPIVRGRPFQEADRIGAPVAVVNEAFVRKFWRGLDPIGRQIRSHFGGESPWITIVGITKDVKQGGIDQETGTEVYFLLDQIPRVFPSWFQGEWSSGGMNLVLRTELPLSTLQPAIASAVREADPSLPIIRLRAMEEVVTESLRRPRMLMHLFAGFAIVALLLAAVGTYGVLSYWVTQRRREIGIRMALGAARETVLRSVMGQGLGLATLGLASGLASALVLTRLMDSLLFGVRPNDLPTLAGVAAAVLLVAVVASLVPAHRATRVEPAVVLREE